MAAQWPARKGVAYTARFPVFSGGHLLSGVTDWDSEISQEGGAFANCTNEVTEIGSTGYYKITITAAEANYDWYDVICKSASAGDYAFGVDTIDLDDLESVVPVSADVSISHG